MNRVLLRLGRARVTSISSFRGVDIGRAMWPRVCIGPIARLGAWMVAGVGPRARPGNARLRVPLAAASPDPLASGPGGLADLRPPALWMLRQRRQRSLLRVTGSKWTGS